MSDDDPQAMNRLRAIVAAESTRRASEGTAKRLPYVSFQPWSAPQEGASAMVDAASWASRAVAVNVGDMAPDVLLASYEKIATDGVIAIKSVGNEDVTARVTELVVKPIREIQSKIKEAMKQGESCAAAASALAPLAEVVALIVSTTKEPSVKKTIASAVVAVEAVDARIAELDAKLTVDTLVKLSQIDAFQTDAMKLSGLLVASLTQLEAKRRALNDARGRGLAPFELLDRDADLGINVATLHEGEQLEKARIVRSLDVMAAGQHVIDSSWESFNRGLVESDQHVAAAVAEVAARTIEFESAALALIESQAKAKQLATLREMRRKTHDSSEKQKSTVDAHMAQLRTQLQRACDVRERNVNVLELALGPLYKGVDAVRVWRTQWEADLASNAAMHDLDMQRAHKRAYTILAKKRVALEVSLAMDTIAHTLQLKEQKKMTEDPDQKREKRQGTRTIAMRINLTRKKIELKTKLVKDGKAKMEQIQLDAAPSYVVLKRHADAGVGMRNVGHPYHAVQRAVLLEHANAVRFHLKFAKDPAWDATDLKRKFDEDDNTAVWWEPVAGDGKMIPADYADTYDMERIAAALSTQPATEATAHFLKVLNHFNVTPPMMDQEGQRLLDKRTNDDALREANVRSEARVATQRRVAQMQRISNRRAMAREVDAPPASRRSGDALGGWPLPLAVAGPNGAAHELAVDVNSATVTSENARRGQTVQRMLRGDATWCTAYMETGRVASCIVRVRNHRSRGDGLRVLGVTQLALEVADRERGDAAAPRKEAMVEEILLPSGKIGRVLLPWRAYDGRAVSVRTEALAFRIAVRHIGNGSNAAAAMQRSSGRWGIAPPSDTMLAAAGLKSFRAFGVDEYDVGR